MKLPAHMDPSVASTPEPCVECICAACYGLCISLDRWLDERRFLAPDVTLVSLAAELGTNRNYLGLYIGSRFGLDFRTWLRRLRMAEAMLLLVTCPATSVSQIGEFVGVGEKSNFHRQFVREVGQTPSDWRGSRC